jgi:hypothetical protein
MCPRNKWTLDNVESILDQIAVGHIVEREFAHVRVVQKISAKKRGIFYFGEEELIEMGKKCVHTLDQVTRVLIDLSTKMVEIKFAESNHQTSAIKLVVHTKEIILYALDVIQYDACVVV